MSKLRGVLFVCLAMVSLGAISAVAQYATPVTLGTTTYPAVTMSDLHFDPFHDPAKVPLLVKAPVEQWNEILAQPDSADQAQTFGAVQKACKGKTGTDAPYVLLESALKAAKAQAGGARFVTVSGDLLVHDLDCKYRVAMQLPKDKGDDQSMSAAFAEKTANFVMKQVEATFPGTPVYLALGNNDSRCNHNRMDVGDEFLKATVGSVVDGLVGIGEAERKQAKATYELGGYYAVTMAAPMERTRLLVLDDTYMMAKFANCEADAKDTKGAADQIAWLNKELDAAKIRGERVWVLAHVPPSVNPKSSAPKVCSGGEVETYLATDALTKTLTSHADVVTLGLFGHTHLDEVHLIGPKGSQVPIKVVASVSAVDGNTPSFTVAKVSPKLAALMDYTVYEASNSTGVGTAWNAEYSFDETYHVPGFSTKSLEEVIAMLRKDAQGTSAEAKAYQTHYAKGPASWDLGASWGAYVCSLDQSTAEGYKSCSCSK